jgi:ADP-heptose:LPS heptosyltransferase
VDTAAAHVAAALQRPTVVIMPGIWPFLWKPPGAHVRCVTAEVRCSPCHLNFGCELMRCVLGVTARQVMRELEYAIAAVEGFTQWSAQADAWPGNGR